MAASPALSTFRKTDPVPVLPGRPLPLKAEEHALLSLIGGNALPASRPWDAIGALADHHRLAAYLYASKERCGSGPGAPPANLAEGWASSYRQGTIENLQKRRAATLIARNLWALGIPCLAVKGLWLAEFAYATPGERPMRDVDILVPRSDALKAYRSLLAAGWDGPACSPDLFEPILASEAHLPPLISTDGVVCELHVRPWALRPGLPANFTDALWQRALPHPVEPNLFYPSPTDTLLHLCVHAAYVHRFDNGPVLLTDVSTTIRRHKIDWSLFWAETERIGAVRGASLCLALANRRMGLTIDLPRPVSLDLVEAASALMVGSTVGRAEAAGLADVAARWREGGGVIASVIGKRMARDVRNDVYTERDRLRLPRRAIAFVHALSNPRIRRDVGRLVELEAFLREP